MSSLGEVCVLGGGTWGTALAKIFLMNQKHINWFIRNAKDVDEFYRLGHNPKYLTNVKFNLAEISFYSNIERVVRDSNTIILAVPSPYLKNYLRKLRSSAFKDKLVVSALKGIVPSDNLVVSEYLEKNFKIEKNNIGVMSGPCHAEEIALERLSFLTVACNDHDKAILLADAITSRILHTTVSNDVVGIEMASVLKNIYAIAAGICSGLQYGDNFQAVLMTHCAKEMKRFLDAVVPISREICELHYLGDMLVTGYSQFSRNRTLGTMIGKGYSIKTAQLEMEMVTEGYYAAKCMREINKEHNIEMPIADTVYNILYNKAVPKIAIKDMIEHFSI